MDIQYLLLLQQFREVTGGIFNSFMQFLTDVGWSVLPFLVMAVIYWCIDKKTGTYLIFNCHIGSWVNGIIKMTACIYRPGVRSELIKPIETATGYSFPSGHMTNAVAIWGGLAVSKKKISAGSQYAYPVGASHWFFTKLSGRAHTAGCDNSRYHRMPAAMGHLPFDELGGCG